MIGNREMRDRSPAGAGDDSTTDQEPDVVFVGHNIYGVLFVIDRLSTNGIYRLSVGDLFASHEIKRALDTDTLLREVNKLGAQKGGAN